MTISKATSATTCSRAESGNDYLEDNLGQNQFLGGAGDDYVQAANNGLRDVIDCGAGKDRADVDALDQVVGCEDVRRRIAA